MGKFISVLVCLLTATLWPFAAPVRSAQEIDSEGFITKWLLLAPIRLAEGQDGVAGLNKEQIKDEGQLKPKAGDKVTVGGKELTWKEYTAKEHFFDFNDFLGATTEYSVGYAVVYVIADDERKDVRMKTGSDDQARVYLNGKQVLNQPDARPLEKDQDTTTVSLKKGTNVIVFKVVNEGMDWSGCLRFTDAGGAPLKGLKARLTP
jgi:hypothetical protein